MIKKLALIICVSALSNTFPVNATKEAPWIYLRDKLIYTPQRKAFKNAIISSCITTPLLLIPLAIINPKRLLSYIALFGSAYLWIRYWRAKENKSEFIKFLYDWNENKDQVPEECHARFERLSEILKDDPVKFNHLYLSELESIQLQISNHVDTSRIF